MIKAVIFDLGGVLIKWSDDTIWKCVADRYHLDFERIKTKLDRLLRGPEGGAMPYTRMFEIFFKSMKLDVPKDCKQIWEDSFRNGASLDEDVLRVIQKLKRNYKVATISNIESSHKKIVRKRGWLRYFDDKIFSCDVKTIKPLGKIYKLMLKRLNAKPHEAVFVDNMKENVICAHKVGMKAILFKSAEQLENDLKRYL